MHMRAHVIKCVSLFSIIRKDSHLNTLFSCPWVKHNIFLFSAGTQICWKILSIETDSSEVFGPKKEDWWYLWSCLGTCNKKIASHLFWFEQVMAGVNRKAQWQLLPFKKDLGKLRLRIVCGAYRASTLATVITLSNLRHWFMSLPTRV